MLMMNERDFVRTINVVWEKKQPGCSFLVVRREERKREREKGGRMLIHCYTVIECVYVRERDRTITIDSSQDNAGKSMYNKKR